MQEKIPEIQNAGKQLKMIDDDFDDIASTMTDGIDTAKQGLQVIEQVQDRVTTDRTTRRPSTPA